MAVRIIWQVQTADHAASSSVCTLYVDVSLFPPVVLPFIDFAQTAQTGLTLKQVLTTVTG